MIKLRPLAAASGLALAIALSLAPISPLQAQLVVFDPSNYAQNIMSCACKGDIGASDSASASARPLAEAK